MEELNKLAIDLGIDPTKYKTENGLKKAIAKKQAETEEANKVSESDKVSESIVKDVIVESIQDFLNFKYNKEGKKSELYLKWRDSTEDFNDGFKVQFIDSSTNELKEAYIVDAQTSIINTADGEMHTLDVSLMNSSKTNHIFAHNKCIAPKGCIIDWNKVLCAFNLDGKNF